MKFFIRCLGLVLLGSLSFGCGSKAAPGSGLTATAVETFLADIAQNIAGDRLFVHALIPFGTDPHEFDPAPKDMVIVSESDLLIVNGGGLEGWLAEALKTIGGNRVLVTASQGLASRQTAMPSITPSPSGASPTPSISNVDPHFWMNPLLVKTYVANILDGLIRIDPTNETLFRQNASAYLSKLEQLDQWILSQVALIAPDQRLLVTDHDDLGYFADRYGFRIIGAILPSVSPDAEPSASQIAALIGQIRATHARAIFLDTGANTQLADQISQETGCRVVTGLYIHSLTPPGGAASTYLNLINYDVTLMVEALR
ncbi:MAG: metal ABC transporter substrate-binding protein [Anaerolineales bacterium]